MVCRLMGSWRIARGRVRNSLGFIDAYSDTTFNAAQVARLEEELAAVVPVGDDVGHQTGSLLFFIRQMSNGTHRYLKFIGD